MARASWLGRSHDVVRAMVLYTSNALAVGGRFTLRDSLGAHVTKD